MASIRKWKRIVVKVGSALTAAQDKAGRPAHTPAIAAFVTDLMSRGKEAILVSSGAVAAGLASLPDVDGAARRRSIPEKQALAAIGQMRLMETWRDLVNGPCAQILLTHDDIRNRRRFINAKNTLQQLLKLRVLPIVNENDSVAIEELRVGDNDNLAAHVAALADADLLLILSDVDGLYTADPRRDAGAELIETVAVIDDAVRALAGDAGSAVATGGMRTKLQAAEKATQRGIDALIARGSNPGVFADLLRGGRPGTWFKPTANPLAAKKHWMLHALPAGGRVLVDAGAARALLERGASLLPSGVVGVEGAFNRGDAVEVLCDGRPLARGLVQYNADQLARLKGRRTGEIMDILGFAYADEIIHRSDMIVVDPDQGGM